MGYDLDWAALRAPDFAGLDPESTVALLPLGSVEAHGRHLPVGADGLINDAIVAAARKRLAAPVRLLVLPALPVGLSLEHAGFPGTLSATPETLLALWADIGRGVTAVGLRKLILCNGHGGQTALVDLVALRLRAEAGLPVALAERNRLLGVEATVGIGWLAQDLAPSGVCGNAAGADAERGARLLEHLADQLARLVGEMAAMPLATLAGASSGRMP